MTGPSGDDASRELTEAVKSAILRRLIAELQNEPGAAPRSVYTKSDSGLYGKYEKADVIDEQLLRSIHETLARLVDAAQVDENDSHSDPG